MTKAFEKLKAELQRIAGRRATILYPLELIITPEAAKEILAELEPPVKCPKYHKILSEAEQKSVHTCNQTKPEAKFTKQFKKEFPHYWKLAGEPYDTAEYESVRKAINMIDRLTAELEKPEPPVLRSTTAKDEGAFTKKSEEALKVWRDFRSPDVVNALEAAYKEIDRLAAQLQEIHEALAPIVDWYGGESRSDIAVIRDAISDLQRDRKDVLRLTKRVKELEADPERQNQTQ